MNITQIIAHNLSAWMAVTPALGTIDKLKDTLKLCATCRASSLPPLTNY